MSEQIEQTSLNSEQVRELKKALLRALGYNDTDMSQVRIVCCGRINESQADEYAFGESSEETLPILHEQEADTGKNR